MNSVEIEIELNYIPLIIRLTGSAVTLGFFVPNMKYEMHVSIRIIDRGRGNDDDQRQKSSKVGQPNCIIYCSVL